jgi:hypothetical protein
MNLLRFRVARLLTAATIVGAATVGAISFAGPTNAAVGTIKCTTLTGNLTTTVTLSGCNGNTGGASMPIPATNLATGGAIPWVNGQTTTVTLTPNIGVESDADLLGSCSSSATEVEVTGTVTADTTGSAIVGGKVKVEACLNNTTQNIKLEPGTALKLK